MLLLISQFSAGQSFDQYLQKIEENNKQLEAARKLEQARKVEANTGIFPKPFSINYGYFPNNSTVSASKQTLQAKQSFHWPGVYKKMGRLADEKGELAGQIYRKKRKELLYTANVLMLRMIYLRKVNLRLEDRLRFAEKRFAGIQKMEKAGNADIMEVNKAKFHLLRIKRQMNQNQIDISRLNEQLKLLNGGLTINFSLNQYPVFPTMSMDSIIKEKTDMMPSIQIARQEIKMSEKSLELKKSLNTPELSIGYGSETVGESSFKGVVMGASIPLWTNKNKVKAAKADIDYRRSEYQNKLLDLKSETKKQYNAYLSLKKNLAEYKKTIEDLESIELLKKSLEMGQISVIDYYREIQYYYDVYDEYLELEKEYYLVLANLYKYRL
jgi:outer membrane protein TolC